MFRGTLGYGFRPSLQSHHNFMSPCGSRGRPGSMTWRPQPLVYHWLNSPIPHSTGGSWYFGFMGDQFEFNTECQRPISVQSSCPNHDSMTPGTRYNECHTVDDPRNPKTRAAVVRVTYVAMPLSDVQDGMDNTGRRISKWGPLIAKTLPHRFKKPSGV